MFPLAAASVVVGAARDAGLIVEVGAGVCEGDVFADAAGPGVAFLSLLALRNQAPAGSFTDRTHRSSPRRTTQIVTGLRSMRIAPQ